MGIRLVVARFDPAPPLETTWYHLDAVGSVRVVSNAAGAVVARHDYLPFGEDAALPTGDPRRFNSKELDPETNLTYSIARYYRPGLGRFTTVDPSHIGGDIADPQSWNGYAYARNNPLRFVDPDGTDYLIKPDDGNWFWIDEDRDLEGYKEGLFTFRGGFIWNLSGQVVGEYQHFDRFVRLAYDVTHRTAAAVAVLDVVAQGTVIGITFSSPITAAAAACVTFGCSGSDVAMAAIPFRAGKGATISRGIRATEHLGGRLTQQGFLNAALKYLGAGYKETSPGRYVSADGLRQVRFGSHETKGVLHGHFEAYDRAGGRVIENTRVDIVR